MKINSQRNFYIIGILFLLIFAVILFLRITTNFLSLIELLSWGTLTYMCFAGGYLYPHFRQKDERARFIREKGLKISMIFVLGFFVIATLINQFNLADLKMEELFQLVVSMTMITIFTSWIVLSKKY